MRRHLRAGHLRIRFEENLKEKHVGLALREASNRFEPLRASGCLVVELIGSQRHHLAILGFVNEPNSDLMQNRTRMDWMKHLEESGKRYS